MRGEAKARLLLARLQDVGLETTLAKGPDGKPGFAFHPEKGNEAQADMAVEAVLFSIAYPACYRTAVRICQAEVAP